MKASDYINSGVPARGISPPQAIELAYTIGERQRTKNLVDMLKKPDVADVTLVTDQKISVIRGGGATFVEIPHHLIRVLHASGALLVAAQTHLQELNAHLVDDFGVVIEDD
jgi:hypothetical protein